MNLPNKLTLTRIILVPVFMVFVSLTQIGTEDFNPTWYLVAGIIFAAASFTDFLDGHLARKWNMVTDFGKFADPLADKLMVASALMSLCLAGMIPPLFAYIYVIKESIQIIGSSLLYKRLKDMPPSNIWGKAATFSIYAAVTLTMLVTIPKAAIWFLYGCCTLLVLGAFSSYITVGIRLFKESIK